MMTVGMLTGSSSSEHYLDVNSPAKYTYGALKCNFNPISEKWEYNYKPEPQGGFFNFALYNKNLSAIESTSIPDSELPPGTQQMLAPMDLTNLINNGNRVSCYARYDNSQLLDFAGVGKDSISQQKISAGGFIPDITEELPNLSPDKSLALDQIQARLTNDQHIERQGPSVAYIKCEVSEDLYMPPKLSNVPTKVWARDYVINIPETPPEIIYRPDESGCPKPVFTQRRLIPSFAVPKGGGSDGTSVSNTDFLRYLDVNMNGEIVDTRLQNLDSNHIYAILTVPGRIKPSVDSRYLDGPLHSFNTVKLKNILTQDVVKGVKGFDEPSYITNAKTPVDCSASGLNFTFADISEALQAQRDLVKGVSVSSPEGKLAFSSPSPVYPDMVALPLMSLERCYGPWNSVSVVNSAGDTRTRYSNIGGKVEFVKDENLAPWNFAGFQLMNEAGQLQAQFSNSLLLFSERGGFVYPDAPTGIALAKALKNEGPLITSISVSVSNSIKTTVKLDLYTASFGKMQKQKEDSIDKLARERQKIIDQNNSAIRRGLGKASSNNNLLGGLLANGGQRIIDAAKGGQSYFSNLETQEAKRASMLTLSTVKNNYSVTDSDGKITERKEVGVEVSMQDKESVNENLSLHSDGISADNAFNNTVTLELKPFTEDRFHELMASTPPGEYARSQVTRRMLE